MAYVPQSAFIYNASVRDNILFGLPFEQERYEEAIAAAAVRPDLDNMPGQPHCCSVIRQHILGLGFRVLGYLLVGTAWEWLVLHACLVAQ